MLRTKHWLIITTFLLGGCIEPFAPPDSDRDVDFLVVDGYFDSSTGDIQVKLSHAKPLASEEPFLPEPKAQVILENESGATVPIAETTSGNYFRSGVGVDLSERYRLRIKTTAGREYLSDFVTLLQSPPIDSVTWVAKDRAVTISVNTHDPTNNTRYYQWRFEETWKYTASYFSSFKFENGKAIRRSYDELIYACWDSESSQEIIVGTSSHLTEDVIRYFPITLLHIPSDKIDMRYSIEVSQTALSREAYDFWSALEQTTENMGGLFDPQPGKVVGNIHSLTDPAEPVMGYFSGGSTQKKRIFIDFFDLPDDEQIKMPWGYCTADSIYNEDLASFLPNSFLLIEGIYQGPAIIGYTYTTKSCADCRLQGGTLTEPDFWEE